MAAALPPLGVMDVRSPLGPSAPEDHTFNMEVSPTQAVIPNFYMTDPISRVSRTMAECTHEILHTSGEGGWHVMEMPRISSR